MSELGAKGNELGGIHRQKEALAKWIETTENSVAELLTRHGLHTMQSYKIPNYCVSKKCCLFIMATRFIKMNKTDIQQ